MARFRSLERIRKVGEQTLIGASGEYGDFQYLMDTLNDATTFEFCLDDGHAMQPQEVRRGGPPAAVRARRAALTPSALPLRSTRT